MMFKVLLFLLIYIGIYVSGAIRCHGCVRSFVNCNSTVCDLENCTDVECQGSCTLIVELQDGSRKPAYAVCMEGNSLPIEDVLGPKDIGSTCNQSAEAMYDNEGNVTTITCICQQNYCNSRMILLPQKTDEEEGPRDNGDPKDDSSTIIVAVVISAVVVMVISVISICCIWKFRKDKEKDMQEKSRQERFSSDSCSLLEGGWDDSGKHSCSTYKYSTSLASQYSKGSRGNALNQNDQHLPIDLEKIIGRGRYADVWKAKLQQEKESAKAISVKVFRLPNYGAWRQEREILSEKWMKHENIIEYYASEQHKTTRGLQYWLITDYYSKGNLQEFLINNTLKWNEFCDMAASIAKGLAYLHSENDVEGHAKLPVAHRDIKSCNILVKDDGFTCVLADFGLSLKLDPTLSQEELANAGQVGTSRYMAPELLERLVNLADIEMFKRVDMYAFALVMWELATRCEVFPGMVQPYQPPYGDHITDHPTKEQILLHVCRSKHRPEIRREWENHSGLARYVMTMTECWDTEPEARLTASCVYQRITDLRNEETVLNLPLSPKQESALDKGTIVRKDINQLTELISTVV